MLRRSFIKVALGAFGFLALPFKAKAKEPFKAKAKEPFKAKAKEPFKVVPIDGICPVCASEDVELFKPNHMRCCNCKAEFQFRMQWEFTRADDLRFSAEAIDKLKVQIGE